MSVPAPAHYGFVARQMARGVVVPFLGAGVNLCERPTKEEEPQWQWKPRRDLPNGGELADYLAEIAGYPADDRWNLGRVSQYAAVTLGEGPLYQELRTLFEAAYRPTVVHRLLASLPSLMRAHGIAAGEPYPWPLLVTTNYDDVLEQAFTDAGERFHVVWYVADGPERGKFYHRTPDGQTVRVDRPKNYTGFNRNTDAVILKIHGAMDRGDRDRDSYVITEDHYIDYLTRTNVNSVVPAPLPAKLQQSHLLFMGYSLADWNLRVILHRIWGEERLSFRSWAIKKGADEIDQVLWRSRDVEVYDMDLADYVAALRGHTDALLTAGGAT